MNQLPVHWHEGMFLRPHHFQAAERYWLEYLQTCQNWDHPFGYGVYYLDIDEEKIRDYQIVFHCCKARLRDGTAVTLNSAPPVGRERLEKAFGTEGKAEVFLAVPRLRLEGLNLDDGNSSEPRRYRRQIREVVDENDPGKNQDIQFRQLNIELLLSGERKEGYEVLLLGRLILRNNVPRWDETYVPPLLACDAWERFHQQFLLSVLNQLLNRIQEGSTQVSGQGLALAGTNSKDFGSVLLLSALNQGYCRLSALASCRGIHPFLFFLEMCSLAGNLAIFRPDHRPPQPMPKYNHDDLHGCFSALFNAIREILEAQRSSPSSKDSEVTTKTGR